VTLRDQAAPEVLAVSDGDLVSGRSLDGVVELPLQFRDAGGGVESVELIVDGQTHQVIPVGGPNCKVPYVVATPCASAGQATVAFDAAELDGGLHTVEAVLHDVAGNRTSVGPYVVRVPARVLSPATSEGPEADPPATLAPLPPAGALSLTGTRTRRGSYKPATFRGTVTAPTGSALGGARVTVATRGLNSSAWSNPASVVADAHGRFAFTLPRGPSREVRVAYGESVQTVKMIVAAPVRLRTNRGRTRNGRTIKFLGTVPGAGAARTRVELQAWAGRWVPFKTVALRNGRFHASYRFTSTFSTTRYRFRAVIHDDDHFPYAGGTSPVVKVVVRP
jgi:hypothetical protein